MLKFVFTDNVQVKTSLVSGWLSPCGDSGTWLPPFLQLQPPRRSWSSPFSTDRCGMDWRIKERDLYGPVLERVHINQNLVVWKCSQALYTGRREEYFGEELSASASAFKNPTLWNTDLKGDFVDLILCRGSHDTFFLSLLLTYLTMPIKMFHILVGFSDSWTSKCGGGQWRGGDNYVHIQKNPALSLLIRQIFYIYIKYI